MRPHQFFIKQKTNSPVLLEWLTQDYFDYHRGFLWYLIFNLVLAGMVYGGIKTDNWFFSSLILLVAGFYVFSTFNTSKTLPFKIKEDGLEFHDKHLPFDELYGYYIDELGENYKMLHFVVKSKPVRVLDVISTGVDTSLISKALESKLKRFTNVSPSILDRLLIIFKI